jgi:hypothetical protein
LTNRKRRGRPRFLVPMAARLLPSITTLGLMGMMILPLPAASQMIDRACRHRIRAGFQYGADFDALPGKEKS